MFRGMLSHGAIAMSSLQNSCLHVIPFSPDKNTARRMEEGFYLHFTEKESVSLCDLGLVVPSLLISASLHVK